MPTKQGYLNRVVHSSLLVGSNDTLFIQLDSVPDRAIALYHINWGFAFLTTPIPVGDYTFASLKAIRNGIFSATQNYTDAFGSTAQLFDMIYQDILVGPTPNNHIIDFNRPVMGQMGEGLLIVVGAPLSSFAGSFGAQMYIEGEYVDADAIARIQRFPYALR